MDTKDIQTMSPGESLHSKFMKKSAQGRMFLDEEAVEDYYLMQTLAEIKAEQETKQDSRK